MCIVYCGVKLLPLLLRMGTAAVVGGCKHSVSTFISPYYGFAFRAIVIFIGVHSTQTHTHAMCGVCARVNLYLWPSRISNSIP